MVRVNRKETLNRLLAVMPGATSKETFAQSNCVVLRKGRFYTFCQEIACSMESGLPVDFSGAVELPALITLLEYLPEEEIELEIKDNALFIKGKGRKAKLSMPDDVMLPIGDVSLPKADQWVALSPSFAKGVGLAHRCAIKKGEPFARQCVHLHPEFVEASDNIRVLRYTADTFLSGESLVRGQSIKAMIPFAMTMAAETQDWLHFRNPMRLRLSIRKFELESYPPFDEFLSMRGEKIVFPKGLGEAAIGAGQFAGEDGQIEIKVSKQKLVVEGRRPGGEYSEIRSLRYDGPDMQFSIPPKLIAEVIGVSNACELSESSIRVEGDKYVYCCSVR